MKMPNAKELSRLYRAGKTIILQHQKVYQIRHCHGTGCLITVVIHKVYSPQTLTGRNEYKAITPEEANNLLFTNVTGK
jgi:hypothetical protein